MGFNAARGVANINLREKNAFQKYAFYDLDINPLPNHTSFPQNTKYIFNGYSVG